MQRDEIDEAIRQMLRRGTLRAAKQGADHITADIDGHIGDSPDEVPLATPWGIAGLPPAGATLLMAALGGRADRLQVIAIDMPKHRPKNIAAGGMALHDAHGNQVRLGDDGNVNLHAGGGHAIVGRRIGKKIYLGGDPAKGGTFSPVMTADGPSEVVMALVSDHDFGEPGA